MSATTPIAYVTLDLDDPFSYSGASFFFDDLILTLGELAPDVHPTIQIEAPKYQRVYMNWYYQGCVLQWTTNLASGIWQEIMPNASGYAADITQTSYKFFRVKRPVPPP